MPDVMHWSGFIVTASEADFDDIDTQIIDSIAFLKRYDSELASLAECSGLETCDLDFGIQDRDVALQVDEFPADLLRLMGRFNIDLVVSRYPPLLSDEDPEHVNET